MTDVYVLPGDEPTLWAYPSQVHPSAPTITATAGGTGTASVTLAVELARDATGTGSPTVGVGHAITLDVVGVGVLDVGAHFTPPTPPTSGAGGTRYPTRIHHPPEDPDPEPDPEECREEDDVLALLILGAL